MLELYYNFFDRFCDVNKFEELELDIDSLYLALSEKELYYCIREESKAEWEVLRTEDCKDEFTPNAKTNFFPRTCCTKQMKHDKRAAGRFKEEFRCTEMFCLCSKTYSCFDSNSITIRRRINYPQAYKLSAGVIIIRAGGGHPKFFEFFRKNLSVPKTVAQ